jgi:hypothetical protein
MGSKPSYEVIRNAESDQGNSYAVNSTASGISDANLPKSQQKTSETSGTDLLKSRETIPSGSQNGSEVTTFHKPREVLEQKNMPYIEDITKLSSPPFLEPATYEIPPTFRVNIDFSSETIKQPANVRIRAYVTTTELTVRTTDIISMVIEFPDWSKLSERGRSEISDFFHSLFKESFEKLRNLCLTSLCLERSMSERIGKLNLNWFFLLNPYFNGLGLTQFNEGFKKLNLLLTSGSCTDGVFYIPRQIEDLRVHIADQISFPLPRISLKFCNSLENM